MPTVASKHVLMISAHEDSWVKVVIDQGIPAEHTLKAGKEIRLEAQNSFNLLIGNAGGVKLKLDNKPLPVLGRRGEIVNLNLP
jgi:cytoskeleton protein RodZ